jgi:hypothetical protein
MYTQSVLFVHAFGAIGSVVFQLRFNLQYILTSLQSEKEYEQTMNGPFVSCLNLTILIHWIPRREPLIWLQMLMLNLGTSGRTLSFLLS